MWPTSDKEIALPKLPEGEFKGRVLKIVRASYRCRTRHAIYPGLFVSFTVSTPEGTERTYSEIVTMTTHHKGTLSKLLGKLCKRKGIPLADVDSLVSELEGKPVQVAVKHSEYGEVFELREDDNG